MKSTSSCFAYFTKNEKFQIGQFLPFGSPGVEHYFHVNSIESQGYSRPLEISVKISTGN